MSLIRASVWARACLTLFCVAILVTRVSGAHLHLCFDGSEPPQSVQLSGPSSDDEKSEAGNTRHDLDVRFVDEAPGKKLDGGLQHPLLLSIALMLFMPRSGGISITSDRALPRAAIPTFWLRPPLRAPPR